MADFDLFKVKVIRSLTCIFLFLEKGLTLTKWRRMTYCASKSVQPFLAAPSSKSVKSFLKKEKKDEPLYVGYVYLRPGKFFPKPNFARLIRLMMSSIVPNIFFNRFTRMSLARGQTSSFLCQPWVAITTVVLPYNCVATIHDFVRSFVHSSDVFCAFVPSFVRSFVQSHYFFRSFIPLPLLSLSLSLHAWNVWNVKCVKWCVKCVNILTPTLNYLV